MQFSSLISSLMAFSALTTALPEILPRAHGRPEKIGRTVELRVRRGGRDLGCVGYNGNFIRIDDYCELYQSYYTSGVYSQLFDGDRNVYKNSLGQFAVDSGVPDEDIPQFYSRNLMVTLDGPSGYNFSVKSLPALDDQTGVPIYFDNVPKGQGTNITLRWISKQG